MDAKKVKVFWKELELVALAGAYNECRSQGHARLYCVEHAQKMVLAANRRRDIKAMTAMPKRFHELVEELRKQPAVVAAPVEQPKASDVPDIKYQLLHSVFDELLNLLADKLMQKLESRLSVGHVEPRSTVQEDVHARHNPEPTSARVKRPHVVLVGLLGSQYRILAKEFPTLDISLIEKTCPSKMIGDSLRNSDSIFGMTTHMSHSLENKIVSSAKARNIPYVRVNGGLTKFRAELHKLVASLNAE